MWFFGRSIWADTTEPVSTLAGRVLTDCILPQDFDTCQECARNSNQNECAVTPSRLLPDRPARSRRPGRSWKIIRLVSSPVGMAATDRSSLPHRLCRRCTSLRTARVDVNRLRIICQCVHRPNHTIQRAFMSPGLLSSFTPHSLDNLSICHRERESIQFAPPHPLEIRHADRCGPARYNPAFEGVQRDAEV